MTAPNLGHFTCNLCGAWNRRPEEVFGREVPSCAVCGSTLRLRGIVALLSQELLGTQLSLADFPELKGIRGFGMSDPPNLASQLEKKFDYVNTFYHQPPTIDVTNPPETEWGRYDFIISSEVMEHVPPPIENGFKNLYRLLKPHGILLLTVPYRIDAPHAEHYPELHEYAIVSLGGKTVLVNRRRDGSVETFESLCFHGGDGSTLELRVFSEEALRKAILNAGFSEVYIGSDAIPEFGVEHSESWSLPMVVRKSKFELSATALAKAYRDILRSRQHLAGELEVLRQEYRRQIALQNESGSTTESTNATAAPPAFDETSKVAELERLLADCREEKLRAVRLANERTHWAQSRDRDYDELLSQLKQLQARKWLRLGRKLGIKI